MALGWIRIQRDRNAGLNEKWGRAVRGAGMEQRVGRNIPRTPAEGRYSRYTAAPSVDASNCDDFGWKEAQVVAYCKIGSAHTYRSPSSGLEAPVARKDTDTQ